MLAPKPAKSLQRRAGKSVGGKKGKALPQPVGFKSTAKLPSAGASAGAALIPQATVRSK